MRPAPEAQEEPTPLTFRGEDWSPRAWLALIRDLYLAFDRRTLGFTRILIGFLLVTDLCHRRATWDFMFSTIGVLPSHVGLQRPQAAGAFAILNAFSTPAELTVIWWVMLANAACLLIGYRTRLAHVLALIFVTGMNGRVLLVENGGYVVENLLLMWTLFLPLGDRFSVDALLASMRRRRETTAEALNDRRDAIAPEALSPFVSVAGAALVLQLAAIYFFNVVHKTGTAWRNGTAVHYVLHVDRMATPIVAEIRERVPMFAILFMTKAALSFEAALPVAVLAPVGRVWARRVAIFLINALHLVFGVTFVLGPFAWSCCVFSALLFSREDWDLAGATMKRSHRARVVLFDPRSGGALLVCRILKRLDGFELLTFAAEEGPPLGIAVRRADGEIVTCSRALADIVAALPLGPIVAWIPRLLRPLGDAALAVVERHDLSRFFGLRVGAPSEPPEHTTEMEEEAPRIPVLAILASLAAVAGAVRLALELGRPMPGVALVAVVVTAVVVAIVARTSATVTTANLRRAVLGTMRELAVVAMIAAAMNQAATELWAINRRWPGIAHVEPLKTMTLKLRFLQGWFMFSPNPLMEDGTIIVDAITVDGRHVDPFTGREPAFDISAARSLGLTQIWCDYFNRMQLSANVGYREAMKEYMLRLPARTGNPRDALVSGDVYWVKDLNPRWNERTPWGYERNKLFSFDAAPRAEN